MAFAARDDRLRLEQGSHDGNRTERERVHVRMQDDASAPPDSNEATLTKRRSSAGIGSAEPSAAGRRGRSPHGWVHGVSADPIPAEGLR